jgi:predicted ArsR family transcriptional regulator
VPSPPQAVCLPPDYLKACLALLAAESPGSVQALTCRLAAMGLAGTERSAVRHALSAMEADGLVEAAFPRGAGRTYRLTVDGTSWLRSWGLSTRT